MRLNRKEQGMYPTEINLLYEAGGELTEKQVEALEWAVEFMEKYEKKKENQRRIERIKMEDDGY